MAGQKSKRLAKEMPESIDVASLCMMAGFVNRFTDGDTLALLPDPYTIVFCLKGRAAVETCISSFL